MEENALEVFPSQEQSPENHFFPGFELLCGTAVPLSSLFPNQNAGLELVSFSVSLHKLHTLKA